jgi:2-oxoglutarate ferredoxin oxidoreductase subunit alpha
MSRILETVVAQARQAGLKVAGDRLSILRPVTLWPFPEKKIRELSLSTRLFLVCELSNGQMVNDVRLALGGSRPVHFYGRMGGVVPSTDEILVQVEKSYQDLDKTTTRPVAEGVEDNCN